MDNIEAMAAQNFIIEYIMESINQYMELEYMVEKYDSNLVNNMETSNLVYHAKTYNLNDCN